MLQIKAISRSIQYLYNINQPYMNNKSYISKKICDVKFTMQVLYIGIVLSDYTSPS